MFSEKNGKSQLTDFKLKVMIRPPQPNQAIKTHCGVKHSAV